jgi:dihydrofolate reductase
MIRMIAAIDQNDLLGYNNTIPWRKPVDMKRFKTLTMGSTLIVGRKTAESLPPKGLPGRTIYTITSKPNVAVTLETCPLNINETPKEELIRRSLENAETLGFYQTIKRAIEQAKTNDIWLAGGASIYKEGFQFTDEIDLTIINEKIKVEDESLAVYFPAIPIGFKVVNSNINVEDPTLTHVLYRKVN